MVALTAVAGVPVFASASSVNPAAVGGFVWVDQDLNGVQDPTDDGIAGVDVFLYDAAGLVIDGPVTTDVNGYYEFTTVPSVDYFVGTGAPVPYQVGPTGLVAPTADPTVGASAIIPAGTVDGTDYNAVLTPVATLNVGFFGPGIIDGSGPYDTDPAVCPTPTSGGIDGVDCGPNNNVVQTQDTVSYFYSVTANNYAPGAANPQDVILEQTLFPSGGAVVAFDGIPLACVAPPNGTGGTTPPSSIVTNPDGSITLTCNLGELTEGAAALFEVPVFIDGASPNGSSYTTTTNVYSNDVNGVPNAQPAVLAPVADPVEISAAPAYNLEKNSFHNSDIANRDVGFGVEPGYISYFTFGISAEEAVGIEALADPVTFTDSFSATGIDGITPYGAEFHILQCIPNPSGWGETVWGEPTIRTDRPDSEHIQGTSGNCAFDRVDPADPTSDYDFTLTGIDYTSGYPTRTVGGSDLSAGPFYVAYYRVQFFVPFRTIDEENGDPNDDVGTVMFTNQLNDFDPNGISGVSNYGDGFEPGYNGEPTFDDDGNPVRSDNIIGPATYELRVTGSWAKYLRAGDNVRSGASAPYLPAQTSSHSGNAEVEPGTVMQSYIPFTNRSTIALNNPMICDVFDNSTMVLTANANAGTLTPYAFVGTSATTPSLWTVEYGSFDLSTDNPLGPYNATSGRYDGNWSAQAAARCDQTPANGGWDTDPNNLPGGIDSVNAARLRLTDPSVGMPPGALARFVVPMTPRNEFFGGPNDGQEIPVGTVLANFGGVRSDEWQPDWTARNYAPAPENGSGDGDRATLTRTQIRLQKRTILPDTDVGENGSVLAGGQIVWELLPAVQSDRGAAGDPAVNLVLEDFLPASVTYEPACTASYGGVLPSLIEYNTPGPGETKLTWNLGTVAPGTVLGPIYACTTSDALLPTGSAIVNYAVLDADNTVTNLATRSDDHLITAQQTGAAQVVKSVDLTLDPINDSQNWTLGFGNFSPSLPLLAPTIIDVFPHNDDGLSSLAPRDPASEFSGTNTLVGPPTVYWFGDATGTPVDDPSIGNTYYSATDPTIINHDPVVNAADGVTTWCSWDGTAFAFFDGDAAGACPSTFADVTALKFISDEPLTRAGTDNQGIYLDYQMQAADNEPGDVYTNRFGFRSESLPPGQSLFSNNVTVRVASFSIGDLIFSDANGNGFFDAGDVVAPDGVTVILRDATDDSIVDITDTAVLGDGKYLFTKLGSGDYYVEIPSSQFAAGGPLEDWVLTIAGEVDPNTDTNQSGDHNGLTAGTEVADGVYTGTITLDAIPAPPGGVPTGLEPTGENTFNIYDAYTFDDFSNLTVDIGLVGPPSVDIQKEICSLADLSCDVDAAVGEGGWVETTVVDFEDTARWRMTVTNDGFQDLVDLAVTDAAEPLCDRATADVPGFELLAPGASVSYTCDTDNVLVGFLNTAEVTGNGILGIAVDDADSAEVETPPTDPGIAVIKSVNSADANTAPGIYLVPGDDSVFSYSVSNTGNMAIANVVLVDDAGTPTDPADDWTLTIADLVAGDTDGDSQLDKDEVWTFETTRTAVEGQYNNWVSVTGDPIVPGTPSVGDSDPANYFGNTTVISIEKATNTFDADTAAEAVGLNAGDAIEWTYEVTNLGNGPISNVAVNDDVEGAATYVSGDSNSDGLLDINETWIFSLTGVAAEGAYTNTGDVTGNGPDTTNPDGSTTPGAETTDNDPSNYFGAAPSIAVVKTVNGEDANTAPGPLLTAGGDATFVYTVTNTGNVPIADVAVNDDVEGAASYLSGDTDLDGLLDLTEVWTFGITAPAVEGAYTNLGTVTGSGPTSIAPDGTVTPGTPVTDDDPANYFGSVPGIEIVKFVNGADANDAATAALVSAGDPVLFTYEVTNTGNVDLTGVAVNDDVEGAATCPATVLAVGASMTCEITSVAVEGEYTNTGDATGTAPETTNPDGTTTPGEEVTDDDPANYFGSAPSINVIKYINGVDANTAGEAALVAEGSSAVFTYVVTNDGNVDLENVALVDDIEGVVTCPLTELTPGQSMTCTLIRTVTADDYVNVGTVTADAPDTVDTAGDPVAGEEVTDDDPANYFGSAPAIDIIKYVNGVDANTAAESAAIVAGTDVEFTYIVTNTGNVEITNIAVEDNVEGAIACPVDTLAPGESMTCVITRTAVTDDYTNIGTVTGDSPDTVGPNGEVVAGVPVTDDDPANYFGTDPSIEIVKFVNTVDANDANTAIMIAEGAPAEFTYEVTNTGNTELTNVIVTDDIEGQVCVVPSLAAGASTTCSITAAAVADDYTNVGDVVGTATDTFGTDGTVIPGEDVTDDDPANYFGSAPAIEVIKFVNAADANTAADAALIEAGTAVLFTYEVTNTGNVELDNIALVDDVEGVINCPATVLAVGESMTCELSAVAIEGAYDNVGDVTGTAPVTYDTDGTLIPGVEVTDDDPANYFGTAPDVEIVKLVNGQDANTVDTAALIIAGNPVTFTYQVTNTGNVDLTNVIVGDDVEDITGVCPAFDLAAGATATCEFTTTAILGDYANVGDVTATPPTTVDPTGDPVVPDPVTDDDPANYDGFGADIEIVKFVNGVDADDPAGPALVPGDPVTFTYEVTNTGDIDLADVAVNDDIEGAATCPATVLAVGETMTCEITSVVTDGAYVNVGDVTGTSPESVDEDGNVVPGVVVTDDNPANYFGSDPSVEVVKFINGLDADDPAGPALVPGEEATFTYVVTNTGNTWLLGVAVNDDVEGAVTCPETDLAPGATMTCELVTIVTAGAYVNVGEVTGTPAAPGPGPVDPVTGDPIIDPVTGEPVPGDPEPLVDDEGTPVPPVTDDNPANYFGAEPGIEVTKFVLGDDANFAPGVFIPSGETAVWTYVVTNTGNTWLVDIDVVDDQGVVVTCPATTLAPGTSMTCEGSGVVTDGDYVNIGAVTGTPAAPGPGPVDPVTGDPIIDPVTGEPVPGDPVPLVDDEGTPVPPVTDDDPANSFGANPGIEIVKYANGDDANEAPGVAVDADAEVNFTYVVSNTGNVWMSVFVSDDQGVAVTCDSYLLAPGETTTCEGVGVVPAGPYVNIGSVTGTPMAVNPDGTITDPILDPTTGQPVTPLTADDPANVFGEKAELQSTKVPCYNGQCGDGLVVPNGGIIEWVITITNSGTVDLVDVVVEDGLVEACSRTIPLLAAGEESTWSCEASASVGRTNSIDVVADSVSSQEGTPTIKLGTATDTSSGTVDAPPPVIPRRLAFTGGETATLLLLASVLLGAGAMLTVFGRRRRV